ncbi:hypothetical protein [Rugamonas sp.]|uniref:hypothetical protein n=1 Tax=Rugamonas sp. TaxID=1926287 RepID=UPI0025CC560C|nr:hypothetical protein [Rugamonas sp.]
MKSGTEKSAAPQPGRFPVMGTTLRAQTLLVLLAGDDMAGVESIFAHRKVTLNTVIRALTRKYGWPIERSDFPTNTADGRAAWASVYSLPQAVIDAALAAGGDDWIAGMHALRAAKTRRR